MNWNTENVVYTGGILNSIKIGAATINEPYEFSIYVTPMDMRPLVIGAVIVIVIIVILLIVFAKRLRKR
jgi:ABC-type antimicrobial peptide transport system permease subunit